jgi:uncharacterized protein
MAAPVAIDQDACLRLLSSATFGRVALSVRALPRIVPVRLDICRGQIRVSTQGSAELGDTLDGAVVALQAEGYDDDTQQVWSVHVVGRVTAPHGIGFVISPGIIEGEWVPF